MTPPPPFVRFQEHLLKQIFGSKKCFHFVAPIIHLSIGFQMIFLYTVYISTRLYETTGYMRQTRRLLGYNHAF